jgi:hypothetical protein
MAIGGNAIAKAMTAAQSRKRTAKQIIDVGYASSVISKTLMVKGLKP